MLTIGQGATLVEIDGGRPIWAVTFSANGEYLVSGDSRAVRVWRVADGEEVGTMAAYDVRSIAVSKDGRWIAAGTELGRVIVWDAHTYERIFTHKDRHNTVRAVDFSPDSTRLVTASGSTASIWDLAAAHASRI
jgi:WD40 repeat protein